jgi:hypothetical protein
MWQRTFVVVPFLFSCAGAGVPPPQEAPPPAPVEATAPAATVDGRPVGLDEPGFLSLFLDGPELVGSMRRTQDTRLQGPDPNDREFARHQGVQSGFAVWMGPSDAPVWRLVDIRWTFPSATLADGFLHAAMKANSERQPPFAGARPIGEGCEVFGGEVTTPFGTKMTMFYYIFRVDNVVVKLFIAQGPDVKEGSNLTADQTAQIASRIVERVRRAK